MTNREGLINLEELKIIRGVAIKTNADIVVVDKMKQDLTLKLLNLQNNCSHELVVRYKDVQIGHIARCLCCTKTFYGLMVGLDSYFQNIIDLPDTLQEDDMTQFTLNLFEKERNQNPELSDAEIVAIINEQVKKQTVSVGEQRLVKTIGIKNK